jgi:photosystem II stability/assembly factor-like uncharacterized protein
MEIFSKLRTHSLLIAVLLGLMAACSKTPTGWWTSGKSITNFGFEKPKVSGSITGQNISVTVPNGTDVTQLVADFTYLGSSIKVGSTPQVSGKTVNNFTSPVHYTVTAKDGSKQDYMVTVTIAPPLSSAKAIFNYGFTNPAVAGTIIGTNISVTPPWYTNQDSLVASFSTTGVSVKVGTTPQISGKTANNFSSPVTYTVTAQDSSTRDYTITVTPAAIQWTDRSSAGSRAWQSIASSTDGSHLAAAVLNGDIWTSIDGGATWTDRSNAGSRAWSSIASSADGSHLVASVGVGTSGDIWTSTDGGATWTDRSSAGSRNWVSIASSADGSHLAAVVFSGDIWTSTDGGATWTDRSSVGSRDWWTIASSADGSHLAAGGYNPQNNLGGYIFTSNDGGVSWTIRNGAGSRKWCSITSSADGSHLAAVVRGGDIWTSSDGGATWTNRSSAGSRNWFSITSSADGSHLAAAVRGGDIWTSIDGGATWTDRSGAGSRNWNSIALSSDESLLAAGITTGDIWTGK